MKHAYWLAALCLLCLSGCGDDKASADEQTKGGGAQQEGGSQPPQKVKTLAVKPQPIAQTSELPGRVRAYKIAEIRPQVSGIIQERLFQEGSFVEEGQQLYQIDPARYEAAYQRAEAALENARAELANAKALRGRYQRLIDANAVSKQELDNASATAQQAQAAVSLAEADVTAAKIDLDYTKVYAPISGYIGPSAVTQGALVTAQQDMPLATVRQLNPVYVDLSQPAAQAQQLQERLLESRSEGDKPETFDVTLLQGNSGDAYPHTGSLDATDLSVDESTGAILLRSVFPNPDALLLPGMFVRATIDQVGQQQAIIVPQKAVSIQPDGSKSVWVASDDDTASRRTVQTGAAYGSSWVILGGLDTGNRVIVEGAMKLQDGAAIDPSPADTPENDKNNATSVPSDTIGDRPPPPDETQQEDESQPE